ncbi:MAG: hypothetical protein EAZ08_06150 [Cytophagales bacterium]|nr:MAG: hypothetical protein EAZ08_06150 [Cytophagales bacterium]
MTKKSFSLLILLCLFLTSCFDKDEPIEVTISSILSQNGGKWKVSSAKFGNQEVLQDLYARFLITFRSDGSYSVNNPDGILTPSNLPTGASGVWVEITKNTIQFDKKVIVREVSQTISPAKIIFEWEVTIPGKVTTTYRLELVRA